jgi:hypothetical protein
MIDHPEHADAIYQHERSGADARMHCTNRRRLRPQQQESSLSLSFRAAPVLQIIESSHNKNEQSTLFREQKPTSRILLSENKNEPCFRFEPSQKKKIRVCLDDL